MGAKESKSNCITYESALREVKEDELKHLREAFKRSSQNGYIAKSCFTKEILGDNVPPVLAKRIYATCGGSNKGIAFKDLLCGLVLFNRGSLDQKCDFLFNVYSNESGSYVSKSDFQKFIHNVESTTVNAETVATLFDRDNEKVTHEEFCIWLKQHREVTSLSRWLFSENNPLSLTSKPDIPTFYQTLAGVTHLEEADISYLEKVYWNLKEQSKSGKFDLETLLPMISPPLPLSVCECFFNVFDENRDGHIDFKEMACGLSAACRGPLTERQKFCFKIFDVDRDGLLYEKDIESMVDIILFVYKENTYNSENIDKEVVIEDIRSHRSGGEALTLEEYVMWTVHNNISMDFLNLIYQVCHIVLGLKPASPQEEGKIVRGWLQREERRGYLVGKFWCLIAIEWWHTWENYVTPMKTSITCPSFENKNCQSETSRSHSMTFLSNNLSGSFYSQSAVTCTSQRGISGRPGQIDNSSLIVANAYKAPTLTGEGGKLKKNLHQIQDYELVPDSLWKALKRWYGGSLCIRRQVIRFSDTNEVELELYPLTLRILRHHVQAALTNRMAYPQSSSWSGMAGGYGAAALIGASSYSYSNSVSSVPKRYVAHTATFSRLATIKHVYNYLCNRLKLRPEDVRLWQFYDECNMTLIEDEDFTLEKLGIRDDDQILMEVRNKDLTWPEEIGSLASNAAEKHRQTPTERGATGLNNLGNTCFMNAALQCVSNTQALTLYFIKNMHLYELNRVNPLGMKGHIAKRYGDLIHDIWSGTARTIAPLKLRWTISKYAPQFNGFQQHDSQELLAFLLDGLHEDLNRVHDKPYLELKDSECRPDVAVAQEAWENHILRNKSIIVDLFHGQLKSKVICKRCGHESVRFDPFNYLSLPLPMESYICIQTVVIKLNGAVPMKFSLRLNADDTYSIVKQHLSQRCGIPSYLLKLVQIAGSNIKTVLVDDQKVKPVQNGCSLLYAYELPSSCNSSGSVSGDEERLSISSIKSTHREAAQTFTAIQRLVRPGSQNNLGTTNGQIRTISEDSSDSVVNTSSNGEVCCSESSESNSSPADCSEILLDEISGQLTVDSGHCSASSASLADSTDTANGSSQQPAYIIALHRKMIRQDVYFVSSQKTKPSLFGFPVIVPCQENTTNSELYQSVWLQVARFVSPLPPTEATVLNHAIDCDYSLGYEFPFRLKAVNKDGTQCAWCPWYRFCRGCEIQCCDSEFGFSSNFIAIDWDPTALHLRYQTSQESEYENVGEQFSQKSSEPLDLVNCLEAFTTEEHLSDEEKYYCSKCKGHQPASKKLQIWRLPPILIIHLKRFQYLNGKWVKSQKVVKFPQTDFDLTDYLAAVPRETINRHRELKMKKNKKLKDRSVSNDTESTYKEDHITSDVPSAIVDPTEHAVDYNSISCNLNGDICDDFKLNEKSNSHDNINGRKKLFDSSDMYQKRKRLESTSLSRTPIDDTALQDFHQHRLKNEEKVFDLKYNLYAVVCHSGILGGGHYVSYACNPNGKWYCYNDSSCREVNDDMDTSCAYMLFYEREGLDHERYLPNIAGKTPLDVNDLDQDFESDYKKMCHLM